MAASQSPALIALTARVNAMRLLEHAVSIAKLGPAKKANLKGLSFTFY